MCQFLTVTHTKYTQLVMMLIKYVKIESPDDIHIWRLFSYQEREQEGSLVLRESNRMKVPHATQCKYTNLLHTKGDGVNTAEHGAVWLLGTFSGSAMLILTQKVTNKIATPYLAIAHTLIASSEVCSTFRITMGTIEV